MRFIKPEDGHRLSKAISFLVSHYMQTGNNPKPVVYHSLTLAFYLLDLGYGLDIAETAILHDLIEDSDTTKEDISVVFGERIAARVEALSFKVAIEDKEARYKEMFDRIKADGREALIVKCADICSNSLYIRLVEDLEKQQFLIDKLNYFLAISKELIGAEKVWSDLLCRGQEESERLKSSRL
ncbi:MAG: HD domain-containing protein [Patescibacteria group bacterium]